MNPFRHCGHSRHNWKSRGPHGHFAERAEHRHGGGRGGRRRIFDQGDLRLVVLQLISEKPRHGYDIIRAIEEKVGGAYSPSPGVVYPTLTLLEDIGHVRVTTDESARKLHEITPEGTEFLERNRESVDAIFARMAGIQQAQGQSAMPQIVRATENFNLALRMRLSRQPLTNEQANAIAAIIDQAATAVEQS
ncbi:PadR family transcriptional regulator [Allomesorhizobium alhagi]|jgi:DNA-binding PadR family transcriptional regulator|uniref:PadR family transcriptional regulator n=1 Tax=Mesorhizobium alhagi CCNWXJ12-2 TaxID=1107882 RepID=H0HNA5_9HYPH|nr:helix-turn-helix transcriptional regulator [Mesorhizobium alhagi]EHK57793.1 PadR family transcriptional regulator [Mesorhizobium alhagi CCNWXJ12-2]